MKTTPRVWFVTGASRGLGLSIVKAALESGDVVAATARSPSAFAALKKQYGEDRLLALALDVTNQEQVHSSIQAAVDKFGRLDIVVNNAGYANIDSIEDAPIDDFRLQFETNFFGTVYVTKAVIPILRKQGSGHILQISSIGGRMGSPGLGSYQSAKWAMGGFSTVLQGEVAPFGIKVTVCEPAGIKTDWAGSSMRVADLSAGYQQTIGAFTAMRGKLMTAASDPDQVAKAIFHVTTVEDPPLRLLLGPATLGYAKMIADAIAQSDKKWESLTKLEV